MLALMAEQSAVVYDMLVIMPAKSIIAFRIERHYSKLAKHF